MIIDASVVLMAFFPDEGEHAQAQALIHYDAAYLALAERLNTQLITGDRRLYNAVSPQLSWVVWIGDYS